MTQQNMNTGDQLLMLFNICMMVLGVVVGELEEKRHQYCHLMAIRSISPSHQNQVKL